MKSFFLTSVATIVAIGLLDAQVVNPFENNRNEFNQKDFISLIDDPNNNLRQQIYGYDWVQALNQNSYSNIVELSDASFSTEQSNGFVAVETANFNGDDKDDIFYLSESGGMWTYGATYQDVQLDEEDSLYHFINPNLPSFINGASTGSNHSYPCLTVGDFNGDELNEVAVAWVDGETVRFQIVRVTDDGGELLVEAFPAYSDDEISIEVNNRYTLSLSSGDFNNDGTDELVIGSTQVSETPGTEYDAFIKVYDISEDENLTFIPQGRLVFDNTHLTEDEEIAEGELSAGAISVQGVRSYLSTDDEGQESIFAAVVLDRFNAFGSYDYMYSYHITTDDLNNFNSSAGPILNNSQGAYFDNRLPCETDRGDINGDAQDDVVILTSGFSIFSFDEGELYVAYSGGASPTMDEDPIIESNDFFDIGDINRDGLDDIVVQTKTYSTEPFGLHFWLRSYSADSSDPEFDLESSGANDFIIETGSTYTGYGFAIGNLDGNDLCLGEPTTLECDYYKPIIILECIPSHFDIIGENTLDINNCYAFDNPGGCANSVSFVNSIETTESQSVQVSSDWSVSGEVSSGFELGGFGMSASLGYKYGEQFSQTESSSQSLIITTSSNAIRDDFLRVRRFPFLLQEYPVLDATGEIVTYIIAAFPDPNENIAPDDDNSRSLFNYISNHEVGNILSYPRPDDPDLFYDATEIIYEFGTQEINTGVTEEISLGTAAQEALENSSTTTETLSAGVSASGFGIGASLNGEYTESETKVFGQTLSQADAYTISPGQVTGGTNTWEYDIYPVLYWTDDRAAKLAMGVDLSQAGANWQSNYGQEPDPALNLPYRLEYAYNSDYQEELLDRTKSVYFNKFNPNPGDTVTAYIRVFNYSLLSMDQTVDFSLYNGNPNDDGSLIPDVDGNTLFNTGENLENQGRTTVEVDFVVTNDMIAGELNKIYIRLDPNDEIAEIHEDNNLGWVNLGLACNTPEGTVGIGDVVLESKELKVSIYPNPSSDWVTIEFQKSLEYLNSNLNLRISDISGKTISQELFTPSGTGQYRFDINDLSKGVYIYQIFSGTEHVYSGKLVVQ